MSTVSACETNDSDKDVIIDFDKVSGNLHKMKFKRVVSSEEYEKYFDPRQKLYTHKETADFHKKLSIQLFDQEKILNAFLERIKAEFEVDENEKVTYIETGRAPRYWWYKYLKVTFMCGCSYDIVPYRWYIKAEKDVNRRGNEWVQGEAVFEHGNTDENKVCTGEHYWQWQKGKSPAELIEDKAAKERKIAVPKDFDDFFPKLDGSDLECAKNFRDDIVGALLHWNPCECLPRRKQS